MKRAITAIVFVITVVGLASLFAPTVILPERFQTAEVIVKNTPAYRLLQAERNGIAEQLKTEVLKHDAFVLAVGQEERDRVEELTAVQEENARLHASSSHKIPLWSLFSMAVGFFANPFSFIITRLVELGAGLAAIIIFFIAIRWGFRRLRSRAALTPVHQ